MGSTAKSFSHAFGVIWGLLLMLKEAGKGKNVSVAHPSVPNNILDLYHSLNSLEIDKLGVREDLCKLGSSHITEIALLEAVKWGQGAFSSPWLGI